MPPPFSQSQTDGRPGDGRAPLVTAPAITIASSLCEKQAEGMRHGTIHCMVFIVIGTRLAGHWLGFFPSSTPTRNSEAESWTGRRSTVDDDDDDDDDAVTTGSRGLALLAHSGDVVVPADVDGRLVDGICFAVSSVVCGVVASVFGYVWRDAEP